MIDTYLCKYLMTKADLVSLLPVQTNLGNTRARSLFVRYAPTTAIQPYVIILPTDTDEYGNTSGGVLTRKGGFFTICVCGSISSEQLKPINDRLLIELEPLRQVMLPAADAADKIWVQYINIKKNFFHDGRNAQGNEEGLPSWKILVETAYSRR